MKRWLRAPQMIYALSHLAALYIRLVLLTSRIERHLHPAAEPYLRGTQPGVMAFWHGRLLMMPGLKPVNSRMDVLISLHRDGLLISETMVRFGIGTISGSSSKGGAAAYRGLLRALKAGGYVAITPDGPRGPSRIAARGVSQVAETSGVPVIPLAFSATRHRRLRSWDRFFLPLPFGRLVFVAGPPVLASMTGTGEPLRQAMQDALNAVTDAADRLAGVALEESTQAG